MPLGDPSPGDDNGAVRGCEHQGVQGGGSDAGAVMEEEAAGAALHDRQCRMFGDDRSMRGWIE